MPSAIRTTVPLLLALALVPVLAAPAAADAAGGPTVRVLVERDGSVAATVDDLEDAGASEVTPLASIPWVAADVPADALDDLEDADAVEDVVLDRPNRVHLDETVPIVGADAVIADGYDGAGTAVAILDTGVDVDHPFLGGRVVAEACFSHGGCPDGSDEQAGTGAAAPCDLPGCDHGTHVAGIAAGEGGVAPGADLVAVQVFSEHAGEPVAWDTDILLALDWVHANAGELGIVAVNLSLGSETLYDAACDAAKPFYASSFERLRAAGVAPVVATGNAGADRATSAPACVSSAISVTATDDHDAVAGYANVAPFVSLAAPGSRVASAVPGDGMGTKSGTSMATPHAAGAFALLRAALPNLTVARALAALRATGTLVGDDDIPRLDVDLALQSLAARPPGPPTAVTATAGSGRASLRWTAPADDGGGEVLGYRVTTSPADVGVVTVVDTSTTIAGLSVGTTYTFTVVAYNAVGDSVASAPSNAVEPLRSSGGGGGRRRPGPTTSTTPRRPAPEPAPAPAPERTPSLPQPSAAVAAPGGVVTVRGGAAHTVALPSWIRVAAATAGSRGAWVATPEGRVLNVEGAPALGEIAAPLNAPIVGMAGTSSGAGYWLLGRDGGIFTFGDAAFHGSTGGMVLNQPVVGLAPTPTGGGYWLLAADGGVFSFGDAGFHGSTGAMALQQPVVGMASSPTGRGYWLVAADGGVFAFGDAAFAGGGAAAVAGRPVRALVPTPTGAGYWLLCADGAALPFGDAATA